MERKGQELLHAAALLSLRPRGPHWTCLALGSFKEPGLRQSSSIFITHSRSIWRGKRTPTHSLVFCFLLNKQTSEISQVWFQTTVIKQVVNFLLVEGLALCKKKKKIHL